jgi:hypothetical protein
MKEGVSRLLQTLSNQTHGFASMCKKLKKFSSLSSFGSIWKDEICHRLLAKGALLIKDAQSLDHLAYHDFMSALVALRKRL